MIQKSEIMTQMAQYVKPMIGWNPPLPKATPLPSSGSNGTSSSEVGGQRLLSLVRSLENKSESAENAELLRRQFDETVQHLNTLIAFYSRRGDFLSNTEASHGSGISQESRKRGNNKQSIASTALKLYHGDDLDSSATTSQQSEALICAAMVRIFNGVYTTNATRRLYLTELCAELCTAISRNIQFARSNVEVSSQNAENDLLAKFGKPMLTGLIANIKAIDLELSNMAEPDSSKVLLQTCGPLIACMKAASSVISLFGIKLARSTALVSDLHSLAWRRITTPHDAIQRSTATLIATIPLAGGTERRTPSELWNLAFNDVVLSLSAMLGAVVPLNNSRTPKLKCSEPMKERVQDWIDNIRSQLPSEASRVNALHRCIGGLTHCFQALLSQIALDSRACQVLLGARLDVVQVLDLVESFLSFPLSVESLYYRTKKRLRNETIGDGLLNPGSCAVEMAGRIKKFGHNLLDTTVSAVGGPALLPYARRIIRISYASLLTSSSSAVRKVLDPRHVLNLDGKKRRWLHTSVFLRTMSIRSYKLVTLAFGSDRSGKATSFQASGHKALESSDGDRTVDLVAGCLIEQFGWSFSDVEGDDDWGSLAERVNLVKMALETLTASLISCGGFASPSTRSLIDSMAMTGLSNICSSNRSEVACYSSVKAAVFGLGSACLATPYPDGAASSIVNALSHAARLCQADGDSDVAMAAKTALRLCDLSTVPRAPALLFVTRQTSTLERSSVQTDASASAMAVNIQNARSEIAESSRVKEDLNPPNLKRGFKGKSPDDADDSVEAPPRKKAKTMATNALSTSTTHNVEPAVENGNPKVINQCAEEDKDQPVQGDAPSDEEPPSNDPNDESMSKATARDVPGPSSDDVVSNDAESEVDLEFPDIVDGGPDSDDE